MHKLTLPIQSYMQETLIIIQEHDINNHNTIITGIIIDLIRITSIHITCIKITTFLTQHESHEFLHRVLNISHQTIDHSPRIPINKP